MRPFLLTVALFFWIEGTLPASFGQAPTPQAQAQPPVPKSQPPAQSPPAQSPVVYQLQLTQPIPAPATPPVVSLYQSNPAIIQQYGYATQQPTVIGMQGPPASVAFATTGTRTGSFTMGPGPVSLGLAAAGRAMAASLGRTHVWSWNHQVLAPVVPAVQPTSYVATYAQPVVQMGYVPPVQANSVQQQYQLVPVPAPPPVPQQQPPQVVVIQQPAPPAAAPPCPPQRNEDAPPPPVVPSPQAKPHGWFGK